MEDFKTSPFYSVPIWEVGYDREAAKIQTLIIKEAKAIQTLESVDLFTIPETEAKKIIRQIKSREEKLNTIYGFKIFADSMKNAYLFSSEKMFNAYYYENLFLKVENHRLFQENLMLWKVYELSVNLSYNFFARNK